MNKKVKYALGFGATGTLVGYSISKFIFRRPSANNIVSSVIGLIAGAALGYFAVEDDLVGEGKVDADSKKNKIVFTRED
jgi:hypothetical protein